MAALAASIKSWGAELGLSALAITDVDLAPAAARLDEWLAAGRHGDMAYMARHRALRAAPELLLPGALRAICARVDYLPGDQTDQTDRADRADVCDARDGRDMDDVGDRRDAWPAREWARLAEGNAAAVALYARGRDYHKTLRARLQRLADRIGAAAGTFRYRVCTDSAPVMEVELARKAGLGWRGKHTLLLSRDAGSLFFLGELLVDLPLPVDQAATDHCGTCRRCIDVCPTRAITGPYRLDARRCISYLTIELRGTIPVEWRAAIGNRVYGCDDCQLACPWNKFARRARLPDFDVRNGLDRATLVELFGWSESDFRARHAGSAILRLGYAGWLRNLAVALGNAPRSAAVLNALRDRAGDPSELVREHVAWALERHGAT